MKRFAAISAAFRYAENAARGGGLAFHCQGAPPVEGFTSPLYMAQNLILRAFMQKKGVVRASDRERVRGVHGVARLARGLLRVWRALAGTAGRFRGARV
jgi:hypothetical protein